MPLEQLVNVISPPRLSFYESYLNCAEPSSKVGAYLAFQSVSCDFFPVLQMVEVALRNTIHDVAKVHFSDESWFLTKVNSEQSKKLVESAVNKAKKECGGRYSADDVVCRLTLGFWVYMLDSPYRNTASDCYLWSSDNREKAFSDAKNPWGQPLTIANLFDNFQKVLQLRNRLFHHEPIWKKHNCNSLDKAVNNVKRDHDFLVKTLKNLSPVKADILNCIEIPEKFNSVCTKDYVDAVMGKVEQALNSEE